jgi:hypothetical protein
MKSKKDDITRRLNKVNKEYKQWKKEQKKKIESNLPVEYQPYDDMSMEVKDDGLRWYCYIILFLLLLIPFILLLLTWGKL